MDPRDIILYKGRMVVSRLFLLCFSKGSKDQVMVGPYLSRGQFSDHLWSFPFPPRPQRTVTASGTLGEREGEGGKS